MRMSAMRRTRSPGPARGPSSFAVASFKHACWFEGVEPPPERLIRAELQRGSRARAR